MEGPHRPLDLAVDPWGCIDCDWFPVAFFLRKKRDDFFSGMIPLYPHSMLTFKPATNSSVILPNTSEPSHLVLVSTLLHQPGIQQDYLKSHMQFYPLSPWLAEWEMVQQTGRKASGKVILSAKDTHKPTVFSSFVRCIGVWHLELLVLYSIQHKVLTYLA